MMHRISISSIWHNVRIRNAVYQILVVGLVIGLGAFMVLNAQDAMKKLGISTGFDFLFEEAGFDIGEGLIDFDSTDSFLRAYATAVLNTLKVSFVSIVFASALGLCVGIARLSSNFLISKLASTYVELFRNTPQLVQIIFWYTLLTHLPAPKSAMSFHDLVFLTNRGVVLPWPTENQGFIWIFLSILTGIFVSFCFVRWTDHQRLKSGNRIRGVAWISALFIGGIPLMVWGALDCPSSFSIPVLRGFNFIGGMALSTEFLALLLGLSLYIAAFIAEIVRSGIESVGSGQVEAARAIALRPTDTYRRIILPQAMRVMIPPAGAQYISLIKNSSLGVAIGYPEIFNINNTIITLSGHTVEAIGMMMVIYLTIAFSISGLINLYNRTAQIKER